MTDYIETYETSDFFEAAYLISRGNELKGFKLKPRTYKTPCFKLEGENVLVDMAYYIKNKGFTDALTMKEIYDRLQKLYKKRMKVIHKTSDLAAWGLL
jgi:hypothetical protein